MLKIYNTLSRKVEEFSALNPPKVTMYSCGPTVYDYQHIGHMRRYVGDDILLRVLKLNGYEVKHAMNITDVGHLVSDADEGEDKMEKGARKFGKSVWDVAKMFEEQFKDSCKALNVLLPKDLMHATDFIKEQIALIKELEEKGYTYKIEDGIYFDSSKFSDYGKLTGQKAEELKAGARIEMVAGKKEPTDFALWKFSPSTSSGQVREKRQMEWESPWGADEQGEGARLRAGRDRGRMGFPGWHIECSAMSLKALTNFDPNALLRVDGEKNYTIDIHTGGIDHIPVHHTNEIAQSEAATGKQFVRFWVHHNFLHVDAKKMSKSLNNFYTVKDVIEKGFDPLALRYLYLQTHYRQEMNFTWESLRSAQKALEKLWEEAAVFGKESSDEGEVSTEMLDTYGEFIDAVSNDLNMPKALAAIHIGLAKKRNDTDTRYLLENVDAILGLDLIKKGKEKFEAQKDASYDIPEAVLALAKERDDLRRERKFHIADQIRNKIKNMGYIVADEKGKTIIRKQKNSSI